MNSKMLCLNALILFILVNESFTVLLYGRYKNNLEEISNERSELVKYFKKIFNDKISLLNEFRIKSNNQLKFNVQTSKKKKFFYKKLFINNLLILFILSGWG